MEIHAIKSLNDFHKFAFFLEVRSLSNFIYMKPSVFLTKAQRTEQNKATNHLVRLLQAAQLSPPDRLKHGKSISRTKKPKISTFPISYYKDIFEPMEIQQNAFAMESSYARTQDFHITDKISQVYIDTY